MLFLFGFAVGFCKLQFLGCEAFARFCQLFCFLGELLLLDLGFDLLALQQLELESCELDAGAVRELLDEELEVFRFVGILDHHPRLHIQPFLRLGDCLRYYSHRFRFRSGLS